MMSGEEERGSMADSVPHITQTLHNSDDLFDDEVDLRFRRESAHAETEGGVRHVFSRT